MLLESLLQHKGLAIRRHDAERAGGPPLPGAAPAVDRTPVPAGTANPDPAPVRAEGRRATMGGVGLGRITRFAATPAGARRVNVMRAGSAGVKALAPPADLFADFTREKGAARRAGASPEAAHAEAFRHTRYRARFRRSILESAEARAALRALIEESKARDVYVMCMCPYRTPGDACHTYLLLELAREQDPAVRLLPEPRPAAAARASRPAGPRKPRARRPRPGK